MENQRFSFQAYMIGGFFFGAELLLKEVERVGRIQRDERALIMQKRYGYVPSLLPRKAFT